MWWPIDSPACSESTKVSTVENHTWSKGVVGLNSCPDRRWASLDKARTRKLIGIYKNSPRDRTEKILQRRTPSLPLYSLFCRECELLRLSLQWMASKRVKQDNTEYKLLWCLLTCHSVVYNKHPDQQDRLIGARRAQSRSFYCLNLRITILVGVIEGKLGKGERRLDGKVVYDAQARIRRGVLGVPLSRLFSECFWIIILQTRVLLSFTSLTDSFNSFSVIENLLPAVRALWTMNLCGEKVISHEQASFTSIMTLCSKNSPRPLNIGRLCSLSSGS